jgi:hypothetical protein
MTAALVRRLTASRARAARACRRRHHLQYVLGYRPAQDAAALRFGTLVHAGLEMWLLAAKAGASQDAWLDVALQAVGQAEAEPLELARAQVMLTGHHLRWKDEPYDVLAVEVPFEGSLRNPVTGKVSRNWRLAGKLDAVVRDRRDGLVRVVEHKTSGEDVSPGSDYWRRLRMDGQVSTYFEGARILGYDVAGCVYNVLSKPRHDLAAIPVLDEHGNKVVLDAAGERVRTAQGKWRQTGDSTQGYILQTRPETLDEYRARVAGIVAEAPEKWFSRGEVVRLESEMAEHLLDTWQLAQQLRDEELAGRYPRNPDACMQPGRTCPYWTACSGEASLDDPQHFTRSEEVHPELAVQPQ